MSRRATRAAGLAIITILSQLLAAACAAPATAPALPPHPQPSPLSALSANSGGLPHLPQHHQALGWMSSHWGVPLSPSPAMPLSPSRAQATTRLSSAPTSTAVPAPAATSPVPASALVGAFTWQVAGPCGYRFLRPAAWVGAGLSCLVRAYPRPPSDNRADRVVLQAYNYRVLDQQSGTVMAVVSYETFRRHPTLTDWMGALETSWRQTGVSFSLVASLPQARVYQMEATPGDGLLLSAYKVDQDQPLGLVLMGYGVYGDLQSLRGQRLWDDYLTMVDSLGAAGAARPTFAATATVPATVPATAPATAAATPAIAPAEVHTTLASGLTIDEYALQGPPTPEPLEFTPVQGTLADILARHGQDGGAGGLGFDFSRRDQTLTTDWNHQALVASETYTITAAGSATGVVEVRLDDRPLYTLPIGDGSPVEPLRVLWAAGPHWLLEAAYVQMVDHPATNTGTITATGQLVEDGVLLNARYGYQQMFGFQLLRGRPFYFYQQAGKIGIAYDGHTTPLGYDAVPHYGCCSGAELNPEPQANMVSFFAQKAGAWYYVEIGDYPK